ncbi:MAG: Trm112 family protein [Nanoarchaeota archaeon]|nr:Trm112 family protein [Nanoarchaeota archaeon]
MSERLLSIICCPACKSDLDYDKKNSRLSCKGCKKVYEIKDGIPVLLT